MEYISNDSKILSIINKSITFTLIFNCLIFLSIYIFSLCIKEGHEMPVMFNQVRFLNKPNMSIINSNKNLISLSDTREKKIIDYLINHSFSGKWQSEKEIADFENKSGLMRLFFQNYFSRGPKGSYYNFIALIHDGDFKNRWIFLQNTLPIASFDNSTNFYYDNYTSFFNKNLNVQISELELFDLIFKKYKNAELGLEYLSDMNGNNIAPESKMTGQIKSGELGISFNLKLDKNSVYHKIANFSVILSVIGTLQLLNSKMLMEKFTDDESLSYKYSSYIYIINIVWNSFICFSSFLFSLYDDRLFNNFIVPTCIYFMDFSYFELKLIFHIWRAQIFRQVNGDYGLQLTIFKNRLLKFYIFWYVTMILVYLYGTSVFFWKSFIYSITSITWLSQIWLNLKRGRRNFIPFTTIFVISLNKIFVPLYFRICRVNFLDIQTDTTFSIMIILIISLQIFVLSLQRIFGMRCLLPKFLLPKTDGFGKNINDLKKIHVDLENMTCSICLGSFIQKESGSSSQALPFQQLDEQENDLQVVANLNVRNIVNSLNICQKIKRRFSIIKNYCNNCLQSCIDICDSKNISDYKFMFTPCKHLFHYECLRAWLEMKNTCPECRSNLPHNPLNSDINQNIPRNEGSNIEII